jgi:hypothetical protein
MNKKISTKVSGKYIKVNKTNISYLNYHFLTNEIVCIVLLQKL